MFGDSDPRWGDPRDRDDESRDVELHWIELGSGPTSDQTVSRKTTSASETEIRATVSVITTHEMSSAQLDTCGQVAHHIRPGGSHGNNRDCS